jgi:hypothetical protein
MDLILHIGTEKTGSSSLQWWLDQNADALAENGIVYSKALLRPANLGIYLYGLGGGSDDGFAVIGMTTEAEKLAVVETFRRDFLAEVAQAKASGARYFVISDEHCHSRLQSLTSIQRVHDLLHPLFDNIVIWCFLRPQIDMCLSLVSTLASGGVKVTRALFESCMVERDYYFNYTRILAQWAKVFGKANVLPIPFKRNKDTVGYFLEKLSLDPDLFSAPGRVNAALDYRSIAISSAMAMPSHLPNGRPNRNGGFFIEYLPIREKLKIDRDFAIGLQKNFAASNAELIATWHQITPEDLEPDPAVHPVVGNLDNIAKAEEFGGHFRLIVERFNALLWLKRSEHNEALSRIEELTGNLRRALSLTEEALTFAHWANQVPSVRVEAIQRIVGMTDRITVLKRQIGEPGRHAAD